jgi:hypothetical protein
MLKVIEDNTAPPPKWKVIGDVPMGTVFKFGAHFGVYLRVNGGYLCLTASLFDVTKTAPDYKLPDYREMKATLTVSNA